MGLHSRNRSILCLRLAHGWLPVVDEGVLSGYHRGTGLAGVQESPLRSSFPLLPSLARGGYYQFQHFSHEIGNLCLIILISDFCSLSLKTKLYFCDEEHDSRKALGLKMPSKD